MSQSVVLITGASSGIGKATALHLLKAGYRVYGAARRLEAMQDLQAAGGQILSMDVTDAVQIERGLAQLLAETGRLDVLINNAGYACYGSVEETALATAGQIWSHRQRSGIGAQSGLTAASSMRRKP